MHFGLGFRQAIDGLRPRLWRGVVLLLLLVVIGLAGDHPERGETTVGDRLATELAHLPVSQQQADGVGRQGSAAGVGKQTAELSAAAGTGLAAGLILQYFLPGLEQLAGQTMDIHEELPGRPVTTGLDRLQSFASALPVGSLLRDIAGLREHLGKA